MLYEVKNLFLLLNPLILDHTLAKRSCIKCPTKLYKDSLIFDDVCDMAYKDPRSRGVTGYSHIIIYM